MSEDRPASPDTDRLHPSLERLLTAQIQRDGSIPLDSFMQQVLSHPEYGYYTQMQTIGAEGDFITAPEISQLFGEIAAAFLAHIWMLYEQPPASDISLFEAGPGHGTLLSDMLRLYHTHQFALAQAPITLLENSPYLQARISQTLNALPFPVAPPQFVQDLTAPLPPRPIFGIANEFFDALGTSQAIFTEKGWYWNEVVSDPQDQFCLQPTRPLTPDELTRFALPDEAEDGAIFEYSAAGEMVMAHWAQHIARYGGAILIADYGRGDASAYRYVSTVQAVKNHQPHPLFSEIGSADVTHLVDFPALSRIASEQGARLAGPVCQSDFLTELGIMQRAEALRTPHAPQADRMLIAALDRLTSPAHMGQIFKIACLLPPGEGLPPGFSTAIAADAER